MNDIQFVRSYIKENNIKVNRIHYRNESILWIMFIVVLFYQFVDAWNTNILLKLGASELNPLLVWAIDLSGSPYIIYAIKVIPCAWLGIYLLYRTAKRLW